MDLPTFKSLLSIEATDTSQDTLLTQLISAGYDIVESYINYPLSVKTKTMIFKGESTFYITTDVYPVISITSITENTVDISSSVSISNSGLGTLYCTSGFAYSYDYVLTYTAGYVVVPDGLEHALQRIILTLYSQIERVKDGVKSVKTPDGTINYENLIFTSGIKSILDLYWHSVL